MVENYSILRKTEAYSFDELCFLEKICKKFQSLKESIEKSKESMAVFFMPQSTYDIFAAFQGNNAICQIAREDIESAIKGLNVLEKSKMSFHLEKKLNVLLDFLNEGNEVQPVAIQADNFESLF